MNTSTPIVETPEEIEARETAETETILLELEEVAKEFTPTLESQARYDEKIALMESIRNELIASEKLKPEPVIVDEQAKNPDKEPVDA